MSDFLFCVYEFAATKLKEAPIYIFMVKVGMTYSYGNGRRIDDL